MPIAIKRLGEASVVRAGGGAWTRGPRIAGKATQPALLAGRVERQVAVGDCARRQPARTALQSHRRGQRPAMRAPGRAWNVCPKLTRGRRIETVRVQPRSREPRSFAPAAAGPAPTACRRRPAAARSDWRGDRPNGAGVRRQTSGREVFGQNADLSGACRACQQAQRGAPEVHGGREAPCVGIAMALRRVGTRVQEPCRRSSSRAIWA